MRQLILIVILITCIQHSASSAKKDLFVNPLSDTHAALAFTCAHQIIPEASADTDVLFKYARWLQKNNLLKQDKSV
ncbi:sel1 repeat family protein, partial [Klebsiella pneumoniae]|nr:sel1 repeat family protein [Klebsiella pneumoniae]